MKAIFLTNNADRLTISKNLSDPISTVKKQNID